MTLAEPTWLWLLMAIPVLMLLWHLARPFAIPTATALHWQQARPSWRQRLRHLPLACLLLALGAVAIALAGPLHEEDTGREHQEGVAIEMLLDISSSMDAQMGTQGGSRPTRMTVAKDVLRRFVTGDGAAFTGLEGNLVGLITFARYADTVCPLTFGCQVLAEMVADIDINRQIDEDGTAYGDALALAAARLCAVERNAEGTADEPFVGGKVIILLTDGENNSGRHLPLEAAALARQWGIRIYAIRIGDDTVPQRPVRGVVTETFSEADWVLQRVAERTGGIFRKASEPEALAQVYAEINQLEKARISTVGHRRTAPWPLPWALAALLLITLGLALEAGPLRRLP